MPKRRHDADSLREKAVEYFADCKTKDRPLTLSGLAGWLDVSGSTLQRYKRVEDDEELKEAAEWAYLVVQAWHEEMLFLSPKPVPHIFYLKSAFGMHDVPSKTSLEVTGKDGAPFGVVLIPMVNRNVEDWQAMVDSEEQPALPEKT